jgi:TRAP-type C4-dicarboxylate transport system substrate-binding protein
MVDGIGAANIGMSQQGHQKFLGFIVEPQFYGNDQVIIMNLEAWNDLPQAAQDAITQAIIETERESSEAFGAIASEERQTIVDEGLEVVMIPDAEQYLSLAREQGWADLVAKSPETGPQLREMLTRE